MPHHVYAVLPADDETKAKIYRAEEDALCRLWILESCTSDDVETIKLGKKDNEKQCREQARQAARKPQLSDQELDQKEKQEIEEKARFRRQATSFLTRLGIALIVVKLYFPDWSDLALAIALTVGLLIFALRILGEIVRKKMQERERRRRIDELYFDESKEKARTLLEEGKSPSEVSKETGLSRRVLKREGIVN